MSNIRSLMASQPITRVKLDLGSDDILEALTPMMESPAELNEAEIRNVVDKITLEPNDSLFEGLLNISQRYGLLIHLAEDKDPLPKANPGPAGGSSSPSSKKKGKSKASKAEARPSSSKDTTVTFSVARPVGGPRAGQSSTLIIENPPEKGAPPPVHLSPNFIQYLHQPGVIARMKATRKSLWETCMASWDYQNATTRVANIQATDVAGDVSGFVANTTRLAAGVAAARRCATGASADTQVMAGIRAGAGARLGIQAAIRDAMDAGTIPQQASFTGIDALQTMLLPQNSPTARAAVMLAELAGEDSGYGLARGCAQVGIPPPNLASPKLKLYRAKVKFELSVGEVKYQVKKLLDEGAAFGKERGKGDKERGGKGKKTEQTKNQAGRVVEVPRPTNDTAASGLAGSSQESEGKTTSRPGGVLEVPRPRNKASSGEESDGKESRGGQPSATAPGRVLEVSRPAQARGGSGGARKERNRQASAGAGANPGRVLEVLRPSASDRRSSAETSASENSSSSSNSADKRTATAGEGDEEGDEDFVKRIVEVQKLGRGGVKKRVGRGV